MTDEQLRAMARRVLGVVTLYCEKPIPRYVGHPVSHLAVDAEDAAVAILREEMDREWMAANHLDDDPTQSFVATT